MNEPRLMRVPEVAKFLDLDRTTITDMCRRGMFRGAYKQGDAKQSHWFIPEMSVMNRKKQMEKKAAVAAARRRTQEWKRERAAAAAVQSAAPVMEDSRKDDLFAAVDAEEPASRPVTIPALSPEDRAVIVANTTALHRLATVIQAAGRADQERATVLMTEIAETRNGMKELVASQKEFSAQAAELGKWMAETLGDVPAKKDECPTATPLTLVASNQ